MKVNIGKYRNWIGPYQIMDLFKPLFGEERIEKFTDGKLFDKVSDYTMPFFNFIEKHRKRKEDIRIDRYDAWSADHTLSLIIVPLLQELKKHKHGAPFVDDDDVPENLKSTSAPPVSESGKANGETDELFFKRWDWVIDQILWSMIQIRDDDWQGQFHTGKHDWIEKETIVDGEVMFELTEGPNDTSNFDKDGYVAYAEDIQKGCLLFGKYYQSLWS